MAGTDDDPSTKWTWLDAVRLMPDWPEELIVDEIEAGRLRWSGYVPKQERVDNEDIFPDPAVREHGRVDNKTFPESAVELHWGNKLVLWSIDDKTKKEHFVTVTAVEVGLPTEAPAATTAPEVPEVAEKKLEPKDCFAAIREQHPRRPKERIGKYADRLHEIMKTAPVTWVWPRGTLLRRLHGDKEK